MVPGFDGGALAGADLDGGSVLAIGSTLAPTAEAGWSARDRQSSYFVCFKQREINPQGADLAS